MQHTILVLAANPVDTSRLRLDQEVRDIREGLQLSKYREDFKLESRHAVRDKDLRRALLEINPTIVHFCGHGEGTMGLALEDVTGNTKLVLGEALGALFKLFKDSIQCVVLNACYSDTQAEVLTQHIPYVVGMNRSVPDKAAIEYAVAFYDGLGAGKSFEFAHELGCAAIGMAGISGADIPVLRTNVNLIQASNAKPSTTNSISTSTSNLSARNRELLQKKLDLLQEQWILETRVEERIRLEHLIEEIKKTFT